MPVAKPRPPGRGPWTRAACAGSPRWTRQGAEGEAHRWRFHDPAAPHVAFRCPHGDHWHVGPPPAACVACAGAGQNSRGTNECAGCGGTGVRAK